MSSQKKQAKKIKDSTARPDGSIALRPEKNRLFLPVLLSLAIIPLIVHMVVVNVDANEAVFLGKTVYADLYSQAKAFLLLIAAAILFILAILYHKKIFCKHSKLLTAYSIACGIFLLLSFCSAAFSQYPSIAFLGVHNRAEGFFILLGYFILLIYTIYTFRTEKDYKNILIALGVVVSVVSIVGIFQYSGHNLLTTDFGKALVISPWDMSRVLGIPLVSASGRLYGTFVHWDYAGSFAAIIVPLFLILALNAKTLRTRIALWGMELLSLWILFGSTSRAGIVGVMAALIFAVVFFWKIIVKHWKISLSAVAVVLAAIVGISFMGHGMIFSRIPSLVSDIGSVFQNSSENDYLSQLPVKDVYAEDDTIVIQTQQDDVLKATFLNNMLKLEDGDGQSVSIQNQNGDSVITDPRFQQFSFSLVEMGYDGDSQGIAVEIDGQQQFYFRIDTNQKLQLTNYSGTADIDSLKTPPTFGFKGNEKIGSSRGYIWSRSLPMVPQHLFLGTGPDTFVLYFPQNDLLGKYWAYGTTNTVVDKPHNLYLQILLNDGGIALLAFLTIMILYVIDSIRLYALKSEYRKNQIFGMAICFGIIGYLFAGLFNDSVVSVAPVFWILLGVGIAVNYKNRKDRSIKINSEKV